MIQITDFPYTVPEETVGFIQEQFRRFSTPEPSPRTINTISETVLCYVSKNQYFISEGEAKRRYFTPAPLTELEKKEFIGPSEYLLKLKYKEQPTLPQMHLTAWAALLWCWSQEGVKYVQWAHRIAIPAFETVGLQ